MAKGDPLSAVIQADADAVPNKAGWICRLTIDDFSSGMAFDFGSGEGNPLDYDDRNTTDANFYINVTRKGFDDTGSATTYPVVIYGRAIVRQAYSNEASQSQGTDSGDGWADIVLSGMIYDEDVITGVVVKAGLARDAGGTPSTTENSAATLSGGSVTNSSDRTYPVAFGRWSELDGVKDGALLDETFNVAFFPRCKRGIVAVKFTATGGTSAETATATVTGPTAAQRSGTGQYAEAWVAELDIGAFDQGEDVSIQAEVFPLYGNASSVLDTDDNSTADLECFGQNSMTCYSNRTGALTMYAAVNHASPGSGTVSASQATAEADPFASIGEAIDAAGSTHVVVIDDGPILGTPPSSQSSKAHIVEVYPKSGNSVTLDLDANSEDTHMPRLVYRGFTIDKSEDNGTLDGDGVNHLWFEECVGAFTTNTTESSNRTIENFVLCRLFNCTGVWGRSTGGPQFYQQSTNKIRIFADGTYISGDDETAAIDTFWGLIACKSHPDHPDWELGDTDNQSVDCDRNFLCDFCDFSDFNGSGSNVSQVSLGASFDFEQYSFTCSLFERGGANSAGNWFLGNDRASEHVLIHHSTLVGAQVSIAYNDGGATAVDAVDWEIVGYANNHQTWSKADIFASTTALTGPWALHYGVDFVHNHFGSFQDDFTTDVEGRGGFDATTGASSLFEDDQSASGSQGGNGDYTPASGSALLNRLDESRAGFDFNGVAIANDGTGAVGAIQPDPAPTVTGATINAAGDELTITTSVATDMDDNARMNVHFVDDTDADIRETFRLNGDSTNSTTHTLNLLGGNTILDGEATLYLHFNANVFEDSATADPNVATTVGDGIAVTNNSTQKLANAYVDADAVDGVGGGTELEPFDTIAKAVATVAESGTIHVQGTFRGGDETHTLPDNVTIQQWAGETQCVIRGDTILGTGAWTDEGGGVFSADVGSDTVGSVVWNWDANLDANYDSPSHLKPGTHGSLSEGEWGQSGTELQIFPWSGSQDPDTGDVYAYTTEAVNLLRINNSTNPTVSGVHAYLASDPSGAQGYGIFMNDCVNPTVKDCVVVDAGTHSIGLVNNSGGSAPQLDSGLVSNCTVSGITPATGSNQIVVFSNDTSGGVDGVIVNGCTFRLRTLLAGDGDPIDQTSICTGAFWHNGAGNTIKDLLWKNCTFVGVDGFNSNICGNGDTTAAPSDNEVWADYAVRFEDCTATNCTTMDLAIAGAHSVGFRRCFFDMQRAAIKGGIISGSTVVMMRLGTSGASTKDFLFESCAFVFDVREFYSSSSFVGAGSGDEYPGRDNSTFVTDVRGMWVHQATNAIFQNCHVHKVNDSNSADYEHVYGVTATSYWKWIDSVFTSTTTGHFGIGATQTQANLSDSDGNLWYNIDTNEYWASGTAFDTEAEWLANIDTNGKYSQDPGIDGIGDTGTPTATGYSSGQLTLDSLAPDGDGYVRTTPSFRSGGVLPRGINGRKYSGQLGPFQYGGGGGRSRSRSRRR